MDLGQGIRKALAKITGATLVDENAVREFSKDLQRVLIVNDVEVRLVSSLCKRIEERILKESLPRGASLREHAVSVVYDELVSLMGGEAYSASVQKKKILLLGLFGSGKTTSIAKLARFYHSKGLKVAAIAADVHRPAAAEQLEQLSKTVSSGFYASRSKDAVKTVKEGLEVLGGHYDVILVDTAGRSAFDEELAEELRQVNEVLQPDEKFLVLSADIGQAAAKQARQFDSAIGGLTGVIVTKMDGSGKGGGALSAVAASKDSKIAFIAFGEKPDAFEQFDAKKFVAKLCGFPDLGSLLEKTKELSKEEDLQKAIEEGKLDYETFLTQLGAMKKMGPLKQVMQMLGAYDLPDNLVGESEEKMKKFEAAVRSMTISERRDPKLMKHRTRQERVARGSGLKVDEVHELVENFDRMQKLMKGMRGNRGMMKHLQRMMPNFKGL